jgi:hypothetical protein
VRGKISFSDQELDVRGEQKMTAIKIQDFKFFSSSVLVIHATEDLAKSAQTRQQLWSHNQTLNKLEL